MRDIDYDSTTRYFYCSYGELIASMEVETLVEVTDDSYQGDTRILLRNGSQYGVLIFGWGSCSGCDALEACDSIEEAIALRDQLWSQVKWFNGPRDAAFYLTTKDWSLEFLNDDETKEFVAKSIAALHARD